MTKPAQEASDPVLDHLNRIGDAREAAGAGQVTLGDILHAHELAARDARLAEAAKEPQKERMVVQQQVVTAVGPYRSPLPPPMTSSLNRRNGPRAAIGWQGLRRG